MEGLSPWKDGSGDGGSHCGVGRKVGRWRRDSACGVVHVVRVRPLCACRVRPLVGFGSRGGLNHKVHYIIL